VKTTADLIALAKAKPGGLSFGSYGTGSSNHLVAELFNSMAGIQANHIPYRGSAPMMTDLIGGRIQYAFDGVATTLGYIRSNTVRMLGVSTAKRSPVVPDDPTIAEAALPGFEASVWFALFARAGRGERRFPEGRQRAGRRRTGCARCQGAVGIAEVDGDRARQEYSHRPM